MQPIQTVIFDLDDTLIDRAAMFAPFSEAFIRRFFPQADGGTDTRALAALRRLDAGGTLERPGLFHRLYEALGIEDKPSDDELLGFWNTHMPLYMVRIDGAEALLRGLRGAGYRLGIITNGNRVLQNGKLDQCGFRPLVDHIIVSGEFGCDKPDARIFAASLQALGASPENAVYIGDNLRNDVFGAHGAGLRAIWANLFGRKNVTEYRPDYEIHTLPALWELEPFRR